MHKTVSVGPILFHNARPLVLIAGPCALESRDQALEVCGILCDMAQRLSLPFIYKTSFDKANRTSGSASRGVSMDTALDVFSELKQRYGCPILTDVHEPYQCDPVSKVVDVLQIPALLCRQTDLITAAARTGKPLHIKKGQFLSPKEMHHVVRKALDAHAPVIICERGTCFGYNLLINDMRGLPILAETGCPIVFDATHSVQRPGALDGKSGGDRQYVETIARAAVAIGVAGVFMETHPDPDRALSDGPNMVALSQMESLMTTLQKIDALTKSLPYQEFSAPTF